jgi:ATP-dependent helicase/nuclease subunit A
VSVRAPSVQRGAKSARFWREVPFVLNRSADRVDADSGPLVNGRVDLVYRDNGELVMVDYKTDRDVSKDNAKKRALKHHSGQADAYPDTLAAATGLPVREIVFIYCNASTEVYVRKQAVHSARQIAPRPPRPRR